MNVIFEDQLLFDSSSLATRDYTPHLPRGFAPARIYLAKGSNTTAARRDFADKICGVFPQAEVIEAFDTPHNRIALDVYDPIALHREGKRKLVLAAHQSAVRFSTEEGNSCPNYWHFSPYGFCPYGCTYCYLAGTQGVRFSPTVKIFLNLPEILDEVDKAAGKEDHPTAFYLGKLQDGLALDPLTGYSRQIIPFFAEHPMARMTLLTKSADVSNLLDLDHRRHSILSWTVNPAAVIATFEQNTPPLEDRLQAMAACASAGYPIRAVVMPIIPIPDWQTIYKDFLQNLLRRVPLARITLGSICSYPQALRLTECHLGQDNAISTQIEKSVRGECSTDRCNTTDGRIRFPKKLREDVYRHLLETIRCIAPNLEIGLCLEDVSMFDALNLSKSVGCCNCVL